MFVLYKPLICCIVAKSVYFCFFEFEKGLEFVAIMLMLMLLLNIKVYEGRRKGFRPVEFELKLWKILT